MDLGSITSEIASVFRSAMQNAGLRFSVECQPIAEPEYVSSPDWQRAGCRVIRIADRASE
jgi:hypothetical protein